MQPTLLQPMDELQPMDILRLTRIQYQCVTLD